MKKIILGCLCLILVSYCALGSVPASAVKASENGGNLNVENPIQGIHTNTSTNQGLEFTANMTYKTEATLDPKPCSISSWVHMPKSVEDRGGVIFGNYRASGETCVSFEIHQSGNPRFYHINEEGIVTDLLFSGVDVRSDGWVHLAFTIDDNNNSVSCYLNGVLQETQTAATDIVLGDVTAQYSLGGDLRPENAQYFKGKILEVALYKEIVSANDIREIYTNGVNKDDTNVLAYYNLASVHPEKDISDESGKGNDMLSNTRYFSEKEAVTDYAYSFAVVGDTQTITIDDVSNNKNNLSKIYDWILANKDDKKIEYVFGLGDVTDNNMPNEWQHAKEEISKLNGQIDYSVIRGNHDIPGWYGVVSDRTDYFSQYLGTNAYKNQFANGGFYEEDNIFSSWRTFSVGEIDYLMITLDFGAPDGLLDWASKIISAHPNHNVIITTHAYLFRDGTTLDAGDVVPPSRYGINYNNGDEIWNKLISKHENIVLVMSGHDPYDNIVVSQDKGEKGNIVTSMLIDPQYVDRDEGATGMVAMLYFSEDGRKVQVEYYSTVREEFFLKDNQFSFEIAVVDKVKEDTTNSNQTNSDSTNDTPKTGNVMDVAIWSVLALAGMTGILTYFVRRRKVSL